MKLTFIGSGSAFSTDNYHSNMLIESANKKLLIDCGSDARFALRDIGYSYSDIDSVYISHIHADHVGGLEWLGFNTKFDTDCEKPQIIGHRTILNNLWKHSLAAGMQTLSSEEALLESYFVPDYLDYPGSFQWEGVNFELVKTLHVKNNDCIIDSYGLSFLLNQKKILITTDTMMWQEHFLPYYEQSDLIFHDCETQSNKTGVHSHYYELSKLPLSIKQKMWLYHYNTGILPNAKADGFMGFVKKGQVWEG